MSNWALMVKNREDARKYSKLSIYGSATMLEFSYGVVLEWIKVFPDRL